MVALAKAAQQLFDTVFGIGETVDCPCCGQPVAARPRSIHATMARQLIQIYVAGGREQCRWVDVHKFYGKGAGGDYAKLRFWDLLEPKTRRTRTMNAVGVWRVTAHGVDFVKSDARVLQTIYLYNNAVVPFEVIGFAKPAKYVSVRDTLANRFDYGDLMAGRR